MDGVCGRGLLRRANLLKPRGDVEFVYFGPAHLLATQYLVHDLHFPIVRLVRGFSGSRASLILSEGADGEVVRPRLRCDGHVSPHVLDAVAGFSELPAVSWRLEEFEHPGLIGVEAHPRGMSGEDHTGVDTERPHDEPVGVVVGVQDGQRHLLPVGHREIVWGIDVYGAGPRSSENLDVHGLGVPS